MPGTTGLARCLRARASWTKHAGRARCDELGERVALAFAESLLAGLIEDVIPLGQRLQRRGRVPRQRCKDAGTSRRESAAVEPRGVAEDDRPLRCGERDRPPVDALGELVVRRVVLAERSPRPELVELTARRAARDVLERPGVLVDVHEVDEGFEQMAVVEVAVPALRRLALIVARGR